VQGKKMMKDDLKKVSVLGRRKPKTRAEVAACRIVVFEASVILKQRINQHSPAIRNHLKLRH
jgi:hypothetical protein